MDAMIHDSGWAFGRYQALLDRLPPASGGGRAIAAPNLESIAEDFDAVFLDAYGVLNVGELAIPGAVRAIARLRGMGKRVMVVSNSAGYPKPVMMARYRRLGFDFSDKEVTSSREALLAALGERDLSGWAAMLGNAHGLEDFGPTLPTVLGDDPRDYEDAEGFLLIGSDGWTEARQDMLERSLRDRPRPVLVGNPDLVAPRESGLSLEPGYFAHRAANALGHSPDFYGKPYPDIFRLALSRLPKTPERARILMVGDTLHTDILGGQQVGFATALVTRHGALKGMNVENAIAESGIMPDFVLPSI